jgi:hypothetical protein
MEGDHRVRKTLNAINLSASDLERAVSRELEQVNGGTVIVRNIGNAASAEKVARLAMGSGWDVGCCKKGKSFLVTLSRGYLDKNKLKNASGFLNC